MPLPDPAPISVVRRRLVTGTALAATLGVFQSALPTRACAASEPLIAAASDLKFALDDLVAAYVAASGKRVRTVVGSSGNFRRQIAGGAPFEVFLSADESYVDALADQGLTADKGVLYAIGRISIIVPLRSPLKPEGDLSDLRQALADGKIGRFAIANPEHAPYGRAAREALQKSGLWQAVAARLVLGENVSQAAQFATSGSTDGGIIAHSLALTPAISRLGRHALIPSGLHAPLRQKMVLLKRAGDTAREFYRFLQSPPARDILARHGFATTG